MGGQVSVYLPPWEPETEAEKARAAEFRDAVKAVSLQAANFLAPHALADDPEFTWDWVEHRAWAEAAYQNDARLTSLIPRLVPSRVSEEDFWRNYFSHIFAIKRQFALQAAGDAMPGGRAAPEEAGSSCAAAPSQLLPRQLSAAQLAAVSYPEKFHLAVQYGVHGPPLPNLSDADRILLEALQTQATEGPCDKPRPGMWDSAEAKAKYEAWKRLGLMSDAEAMHLYVQAIEVFDANWLDWVAANQQPGVRSGVGGEAPSSSGGKRNGSTAEAPPLVTTVLREMRALRAVLRDIPPAQLAAVRDECTALARALDACADGVRA